MTGDDSIARQLGGLWRRKHGNGVQNYCNLHRFIVRFLRVRDNFVANAVR
jgi:hypothetical protein